MTDNADLSVFPALYSIGANEDELPTLIEATWDLDSMEPVEIVQLRYASERLEAEAIVNGFVTGDPDSGWHFIDNASNDLLREIIKQLVAKLDSTPPVS